MLICFSLNIVCPTSYNLAEFLVSQLNVTDHPESQSKIKGICSKYAETEVGKEHERKLEKLKHEKKYKDVLEVNNGVPHYSEVSKSVYNFSLSKLHSIVNVEFIWGCHSLMAAYGQQFSPTLGMIKTGPG